jgi:thiamine-phosphate pyrophosphorylase
LTTLPDSASLLTVISDDTLPADRVVAIFEVVVRAVPVTVQLRARGWSGLEFHRAAERLREITRLAGSRLVVHDRVDVAIAIRADGVHLPADGIDPRRARALLDARDRSTTSLGLSVHSTNEIRAHGGETDNLQFGPVFETASKRAFGRPQGLDGLRRAVDAARALGARSPRVIAVGGIEPRNAGAALGAGTDGIAVIGAVMRASDPAAAARDLVATLTRGRASLRSPDA